MELIIIAIFQTLINNIIRARRQRKFNKEVATKIDKLKRNEVKKCLDKIKTTLELTDEEVLIPSP